MLLASHEALTGGLPNSAYRYGANGGGRRPFSHEEFSGENWCIISGHCS